MFSGYSREKAHYVPFSLNRQTGMPSRRAFGGQVFDDATVRRRLNLSL